LDGDTPLLTGMTVENNIVTQEKADALLVPTSALKDDAVWVVQGGKLEKRKVAVGVRGLEKAAVSGALSESDLVVDHPADDLKESQLVRVREKK
jgi:multidrug efflux pump subunit AcrA (membrane-fusion protein)